MTKEEVKNLPIGTIIFVKGILFRECYQWKNKGFYTKVDKSSHFVIISNNSVVSRKTAYYVGMVTLYNGKKNRKNFIYNRPKYGFVSEENFLAARVKFGNKNRDYFVRFEDMELINEPKIMLDLSKLCKEEVDEIIAYYKGFQK